MGVMSLVIRNECTSRRVHPKSHEPSSGRPVHRSKTLRLPKMSFDGTYWQGFVSQFEAYARRMQWTKLNKIDTFTMCLRKKWQNTLVFSQRQSKTILMA